jgi:TolB-like protein
MALGYFAFDKFVLSVDRDAALIEATTQTVTEQVAGDSAASMPSDKSIAVLPFVNLSSDPEQDYFSDGISEELLNVLAQLPGLRVAARTSSFFYKGKLETITLAEIAQQLDVAHILEGSVRKSANKLRITAQLIKADDGLIHQVSNARRSSRLLTRRPTRPTFAAANSSIVAAARTSKTQSGSWKSHCAWTVNTRRRTHNWPLARRYCYAVRRATVT